MTSKDEEQQIVHQYRMLPLDEDEAKHLKQVPKDVARLLLLANTGAILSAICISDTPGLKEINTSSPIFIKALLTSKCANLLRLSTTSLSTGYYAGAAILLRAAFESLDYFFYFMMMRMKLNSGLNSSYILTLMLGREIGKGMLK